MQRTYLTFLGWTVFLFGSAFLTEKGLRTVYTEQKKLDILLENLQTEKDKALSEHLLLTQKINSQSDPEWVELVLKRELDVIEEGHIKIFFKPPRN